MSDIATMIGLMAGSAAFAGSLMLVLCETIFLCSRRREHRRKMAGMEAWYAAELEQRLIEERVRRMPQSTMGQVSSQVNEKHVAKTPSYNSMGCPHCPDCGYSFDRQCEDCENWDEHYFDYCPSCGKAIDWSKHEAHCNATLEKESA